MLTKNELRKSILSIRNNMDEKEMLFKSKQIIKKLTSLEEFAKSNTVFIYMSFKNEVETINLIKQMLLENKRVVIPYTDTKNTVLIPSEINSISDLKLSSFGYYEPDLEKVKKIKPHELDLIVTPGVVFDKSLNRIGFGKGYYDRILALKRTDAKAIALAYEFQVLEEIPSELHDIKINMIITEKNIYSGEIT